MTTKVWDFTITIRGEGETQEEAWNAAVAAFTLDPGCSDNCGEIVEDDEWT